uniref:NADH-ubiquinone oxidoreductase chain 3 n=1 Tax=Ogadenus brumpti TaxID=1827023 RepID=A0A1P8AG16_9ACAR|nr:NADH dehydrogenase subunit 3 [Ogadenus brumpti]AMX74046.1 NADH dehydrogenase subunit 3 [Ogadenus brumpti]AMX74059.1 NADH dehydrogenase subunit 3 [Ogadenus brumpti]
MKYLILISTLSFCFFIVSLLTKKKTNLSKEKLSPFECGFDPFTSSRLPFSIRFFMITIIFLIFDIEIIILLPLPIISNLSHWSLPFSFFLILTIIFIGLIYEWKKGMIEWLK